MIRNILFTVVFFLGIIFISIIFLPSLIMPPAVTLMGGKIMGYWAKYCLRIFLSVKINIIGRENIVNGEKFFRNRNFCLSGVRLRDPLFSWCGVHHPRHLQLKQFCSIIFSRKKVWG